MESAKNVFRALNRIRRSRIRRTLLRKKFQAGCTERRSVLDHPVMRMEIKRSEGIDENDARRSFSGRSSGHGCCSDLGMV